MTDLTELLDFDGTGQADLVADGSVSPFELVDATIRRIESLNPSVNAVIHERFEKALVEAASSDLPRGPLRGVPTLLKDLGCPMAGEALQLGSEFFRRRGACATQDAALTTSIKQAGMVILGRTNVPEFGLVSTTEPEAFGVTRNPWNDEHSPGGSSGGAAAAVASGMVPVAQGSDGGGSIRMPSSYCGLVGLKPTRNRISLAPDGEPMEGHTTYGFLTKSVRDCALTLDFAAGHRFGDASMPPTVAQYYAELARAEPQPLRVGAMIVRDVNDYPVDDEVNRVVREVAEYLELAGHHVENSYPAAMRDPEYLDRWVDLLSPSVSETFARMEALAGRPVQPEEAEEVAWWWNERGQRLTATRHIQNQMWCDDFRRRMAAWWADGFDVLLSPVCPHPAPPLGSFRGPEGIRRSVDVLCFTPQFNTTGQPAISLPLGTSTSGLPIGVQLTGGFGREDVLLQLAGQLERAMPWKGRRAPMHA